MMNMLKLVWVIIGKIHGINNVLNVGLKQQSREAQRVQLRGHQQQYYEANTNKLIAKAMAYKKV